jgi:hypothetical protein
MVVNERLKIKNRIPRVAVALPRVVVALAVAQRRKNIAGIIKKNNHKKSD